MSSKPKKATEIAQELRGGVLAPSTAPRRSAARREPPPASLVEAQLRARVGELEAQLTEVVRCLEAAEARATDRLALQAELDRSEHKLAVIAASRSWRLTRLPRTSMTRARRLLRH